MHKLLRILEVLVLILTVDAVDYDVYKFGNPAFPQNSPTSPGNLVNLVLLPSEATTQGKLFAFSAAINSNPLKPFDFQIYRQRNTTTSYALIFKLTVTPSVSNQREYYYIESFLGAQPCINILPGDRLGVYFYSSRFEPIPLTFYFETKPAKTSSLFNIPPVSVGQTLELPNSLQPYFVDVTAYYAVNPNNSSPVDSSNITTDCINGLFVVDPQGLNQTRTTTTTPSPIIGKTGAQGFAGFTGATGYTGNRGIDGIKGPTGQQGLRVDGYTGSTGPTGDTGIYQGYNGSIGLNGSDGFTGAQGQMGLEGAVGPNGSVGANGSDFIIRLYGPYYTGKSSENDDNFFLSSKAILGLYIWLAIDSFGMILSLVVIIITCCFHSDIKNVMI